MYIKKKILGCCAMQLGEIHHIQWGLESSLQLPQILLAGNLPNVQS